METLNLNAVSIGGSNKLLLQQAGPILAVIRYHKLSSGVNGVSYPSMRALMQNAFGSCPALLREYVCAFGSEGESVVVNLLRKSGVTEEELLPYYEESLQKLETAFGSLNKQA